MNALLGSVLAVSLVGCLADAEVGGEGGKSDKVCDEQGRCTTDERYFTLEEVEAALDALVATYPGLATKIDLTTYAPGAKPTHEGRSIYALRISDASTTSGSKRSIVIASQHHPRELNTAVVTLTVAEELLKGYANDRAIQQTLEDSEIFIIPTVNPDGLNYLWQSDVNWRLNRRPNPDGSYGVDLNRNYSYRHGELGSSFTPGDSTYHGPGPASEPETQTMQALQDKLQPEIYFDVHSAGRLVMPVYRTYPRAPELEIALANHYANALAQPMSYRVEVSPVSGASSQQFWSRGTMSMAIETGMTMQPVFEEAQTEALRIWGGIKEALLHWAPGVRGQIRAAHNQEPIAATISIVPSILDGAESVSRPSDGSYALWLPPGTHEVTFLADGYQPVTHTVQIDAYDSATSLDIEMTKAN